MTDPDHTPDSPSQTCRTCERPITTDTPTYPFCSDRCRLVDMGKWFDGEYRISREINDSDLDTVD